MKYQSYWHDTAPVFSNPQRGPVAGSFDVAVIGGGFTGLNAARKLAREGVSVALLEADHVGAGGSGRNGGHLNNGIAHGYASAKAHLGTERAHALYKAYDRSIDMIEEVIAEEGIACDFRRAGKLKLASKPSHVDGLKANYELIHREVDPETRWLDKADLDGEIGSDAFHGGMLYEKTAMMHMGRYVTGLAEAAHRHGAQIWEAAPVTERTRSGSGWTLSTPKGALKAGRVIVATGAYAGRAKPSPFQYFRRRIISVGSFIIATRPLMDAEVQKLLPGNRTYVTSMNIGNYIRLSPDNRIIFGGRARFSATSDQRSDAKSGEILKKSFAQVFPEFADIQIDYCWGGLVGMTQDRYPRAGEHDGMIYGMGYSGHGAQMSTLIGQALADMAMGREGTNPLDGLDWPTIPMHSGTPWFLPLVGMWFGLKDRLS
ncbi:MAG: FAD-binding oxidoreductase [Rhodobacteraceae bacterium]|jgi:glycine/D-amino acid oxidase-like deaminating enzyme|uniref:Glycine/D-amino acid oxidase, deaminating n=1 Tax=Salipiger profundus TaxID=1229727 RepID=A0A1U7D5J2_9RHOB|nr:MULTISPECIES: FAD-binding oxidoreductase [Salipiger]APX23409.1 glycine/D-amino acid oxidase, deaminating [Salipiger profundus]MAB06684.1 FAD-binding oxidoreductase [Paracoccaceae bacterium]GGA28878.1 oxidoreductase [Salipiger profundus]SFD89491.1 Glycine/D-amino acid oxidase [Salipiger profundus]